MVMMAENSQNRLAFHELQPQDWGKLLQIPIMQQHGLPDPRTTRVIVGEDAEGFIRAYWFYFIAVHVEPLWVDPEYRKQPSVIRSLWGGIYNIMESSEAPLAFAVIEDKDLPQGNAEWAGRLGFEKIEGSLYFVRRQDRLDVRGPKVQQLVEASK